MSQQEYITQTAEFVKEKFSKETTGHDWWHMYRVWQLVKQITAEEKGVDMLVVELGALLHDIADWKFHTDEEAGPKAARAWLESIGVEEVSIAHVESIVRNVSYKGANVKNDLNTIEGQIIWDADKLDAIGAVGIARCFSFGGSVGHTMYDPSEKPVLHDSFEDYKKMSSSSVAHFYEKLLLLKDKMYTKTGKQLAESRHDYMENFLKEFYAEWNGEK